MRIAYVYFAVGLVYGVGLGVLLVQSSMINLSVLSFMIGALLLIPALAWVETRSHQYYVSRWERIRDKGRFMFIFIQYVLVRGLILSTALVLFLRAKGQLSSLELVGVVVILIAIAAVGNQEWENCQQESRVLALKSAAERLKTLRLQVKEGTD